jgi:hypothetical protein
MYYRSVWGQGVNLLIIHEDSLRTEYRQPISRVTSFTFFISRGPESTKYGAKNIMKIVNDFHVVIR